MNENRMKDYSNQQSVQDELIHHKGKVEWVWNFSSTFHILKGCSINFLAYLTCCEMHKEFPFVPMTQSTTLELLTEQGPILHQDCPWYQGWENALRFDCYYHLPSFFFLFFFFLEFFSIRFLVSFLQKLIESKIRKKKKTKVNLQINRLSSIKPVVNSTNQLGPVKKNHNHEFFLGKSVDVFDAGMYNSFVVKWICNGDWRDQFFFFFFFFFWIKPPGFGVEKKKPHLR